MARYGIELQVNYDKVFMIGDGKTFFHVGYDSEEWDLIRWYVLTIPNNHRGKIKGLEIEQKYRMEEGRPLLEVFNPSYEEVYFKDGKWVKTRHQLYFNYVFVRSSVRELYSLKADKLVLLSFLSPTIVDGIKQYPYVPDSVMRSLQWIAASYNKALPLYYLNKTNVERGDKVRIVKGPFKGIEAVVMLQTGSGIKKVVVQVQGSMCVPLMSVKEDDYEIIELGGDRKRVCSQLDNTRLAIDLHEALLRFHRNEQTNADLNLAEKTLRRYEHLRCLGEDELKAKLFVAQAYTILGRKDLLENTISEIVVLLKSFSKPHKQLYAQSYITIYGCTNDYEYCQYAHDSVASWNLSKIKKSRCVLLSRLIEYDILFGH